MSLLPGRPIPRRAISLLSGAICGIADDDSGFHPGLLAREQLDRDRRLRGVVARPRRRRARAGIAARLPAWILSDPADRSRRGTLCPGDQTDAGNRRVRRYPVPGRGPLQEAGRHLLVAGWGGQSRERAWHAERPTHDLGLPYPLADRCDRRGAADLLGSALLRLASCGAARRIDDGNIDPARRRSPPCQ